MKKRTVGRALRATAPMSRASDTEWRRAIQPLYIFQTAHRTPHVFLATNSEGRGLYAACTNLSRPRKRKRRRKFRRLFETHHTQTAIPLIAKPNADAGIGSIESAVLRFARVDAAIDGIEEEIRAIADADFGVGVAI